MRANNLSIAVPYKGCDKACPYCVSRITGYHEETDLSLMRTRFSKVKQFARMAGVTSVSMTGKGEPMLNKPDLYELMEAFMKFPIELQTNGVVLRTKPDTIRDLVIRGLDVLALSIDKLEEFTLNSQVCEVAHDYNITTRATVNITDMISKSGFKLTDFIASCKKYSFDQLTFRNIMEPNFSGDTKTGKWIKKHSDPRYFIQLENEIQEHGRLIRTLPYHADLYDVDGIGVTTFEYCMQDSSSGSDIRSLIFQEDGHVYTAWNSDASRLF